MSPNGNQYIDDMEFNRQLDAMGNDIPQLVKFIAWRQYDMAKKLETVTQLCPVHSKQIRNLEKKSNKTAGAIGGIGAGLGSALTILADYLLRRGT